LGEPEVLERVRVLLAPEATLEEFVLTGLAPEQARARTAALRAMANRPVFD
jgi:hypothetical protein